MQSYKRRKSSSTRYGEKTSEFGFYAPNPGKGYGGRNPDGSRWSTTYFQWNERPAPQAAPAPAPKAAPKPAPKPISNPYKDQADQLMKTIKQMETNQTQKIAEIQEAAKARITYATPQAVQPANLTIAAAGSQPKQTGSSTFKRRSMQSPSTSNLRTINSMNI